MLSGLRDKASVAESCWREGIAASLYDCRPKEFLEAGKERLVSDSYRQASSADVEDCAARSAV